MCLAGYLVDYKGALHCFPSGEMVIRLLLLLWTGDHPAQCEICKSKGAGGKKGWRRCKMLGMPLLHSNYYDYIVIIIIIIVAYMYLRKIFEYVMPIHVWTPMGLLIY